jgi:hypothetical protein
MLPPLGFQTFTEEKKQREPSLERKRSFTISNVRIGGKRSSLLSSVLLGTTDLP